MKILFSLALCFLVFASCGDSNKIASDTNPQKLRGTWQLNYITGPRIAFDGLYPNDKPVITFDVSDKRVSGNNSCNSYSGAFSVDGAKINFKESLATTKIACLGEGESVFMRTLLKINTYEVTQGYTLSFFTDGVASMRFTKVK